MKGKILFVLLVILSGNEMLLGQSAKNNTFEHSLDEDIFCLILSDELLQKHFYLGLTDSVYIIKNEFVESIIMQNIFSKKNVTFISVNESMIDSINNLAMIWTITKLNKTAKHTINVEIHCNIINTKDFNINRNSSATITIRRHKNKCTIVQAYYEYLIKQSEIHY